MSFVEQKARLQALPQDPDSIKLREGLKQHLLEFLAEFCKAFGSDCCCIDYGPDWRTKLESGKERPAYFECSFGKELVEPVLFAIEYPHIKEET